MSSQTFEDPKGFGDLIGKVWEYEGMEDLTNPSDNRVVDHIRKTIFDEDAVHFGLNVRHTDKCTWLDGSDAGVIRDNVLIDFPNSSSNLADAGETFISITQVTRQRVGIPEPRRELAIIKFSHG